MKFPDTYAGLVDAGYEPPPDDGRISRCRSCNAEIMWWKTPRGKSIPLDIDTYVAHFQTCPDADKFRRK